MVRDCVFRLVFLFGILCCFSSSLSTDEVAAKQWLADYDQMAMMEFYEQSEAAWEYYTDLTDENKQAMAIENIWDDIKRKANKKVNDDTSLQDLQRILQQVWVNQQRIRNLINSMRKRCLEIAANLKTAQFVNEAGRNASGYDDSSFSFDTKRQLSKLKVIGSAALPKENLKQLNNVLASMESRYSKGKACRDDGECMSLEPDLTRIMATSRNYAELNWAWQKWREAVGPGARSDYTTYVGLSNEAAIANGFADGGDYRRSWYEANDFMDQIEALYQQLGPLYQNLHAYVRRKLYIKYGSDYINLKGPIPAHILGNMWSQSWLNILDEVLPYPNAPSIDVTPVLKSKNYNATRMFEVSEEFFTSLGLIGMPTEFWKKSMIVKPKDREVVCHASAWDFSNQRDFRIKQCTDITMDDFITIHHEMGHIEYYLQYKDKPVVYRGGANPGFHEAVGDTLALSVSTPKHLYAVGLLDSVEENDKSDMNFLMSMALDKIAFLPFGYLMDKWRWGVFDGNITEENYNTKWWELRTQYQGIVPPTPRTEANFDPAAKYHIPADTAYIRYFVSHILQFQFHKAMCDAANHTGLLLRCDVYQNTDAGRLLGDMLQMGESKPWPEALEKIVGSRIMSAQPLLDYFKPLLDWLVDKNKANGEQLGWDVQFQPKEPPFWYTSGTPGAPRAVQATLGALFLLVLMTLYALQ